jgi:putative hydrolase of the HAD superfamily
LIKHVFFDLGLTLVKNNLPESFHSCIERAGYTFSLEDVKLAYHLANKEYMKNHPGTLGNKSEDTLTGYLSTIANFLQGVSLGQPFFKKHLADFRSISWVPYPWTFPTLQVLHDQGIDIGLISNWDLGCRTVLAETRLDIFLDPIVISSEVQIEKPDKRIFEHAIKCKEWKSEECLYVGDNYYDDVLGATQVGMHSCLLNFFGAAGIEELNHPYILSSIQTVPSLIGQGIFDQDHIV